MKRSLAIVGAVFAVALAVVVGSRMSADSTSTPKVFRRWESTVAR